MGSKNGSGGGGVKGENFFLENCIQYLKGKRDGSVIQALGKAESELFGLLQQEEDFWHQRAKLFWLHTGDLNTKAFHSAVKGRSHKKKISILQGVDGN